MKVQPLIDGTPTAEDRKASILAAAAKLFALKGVAGTSMREIGDEVGINPGALYHYFRSKSAIVNELITNYLSDLLKKYQGQNLQQLEPRARLRAIVTASLATGAAQPSLTKVYQAEFGNLRDMRDYAAARLLAESVQSVWLDAIDAGKEDGTLRKDVPSKVFHRFIRDAVWLTVYWHRPDDPYTLEDLAEDCMTVFVDGMSA